MQIVKNIEIINIDGIRVTSKDGWWLLRASNTQPALVARCESHTKNGLIRLRGLLGKHLSECGIKNIDLLQ